MPGTQHFDAVVIGGGSGLTAAYYAAQDGKSIALIDSQPDALGGTCINFGCIPTKTLIQSAQVMNTIRDAERFGISLDQASVRVDFNGIMQAMRKARADNAAGVKQWVEKSMTPFYDKVRFVGDKLLETGAGQRVTGDKIFIATGANAAVPPIDGLTDTGYWTNKDVLELEQQPNSLIVIGGGYIGAELGHFFASLGTGVTVIDGSSTLLREDDDVGALFTREFSKKVRVVTGRAVSVRAHGSATSVTVESEGRNVTLRGDQLLVAAGRRPNTAELALDATGVEIGDGGSIRVDDHLRTAHPDIYAYGDVIGQAMFKHTSSYEGELAYRNSQGSDETVSYFANPHAVFSDPQIGSVGLSERQCRDRGFDYQVARTEYADVAKGQIIGSPRGFAKLLVENGSDRILGFHMIGPNAADLIHEVVVAMNADGGKASLIRRSIHIHPTMPELIRAVFDATG